MILLVAGIILLLILVVVFKLHGFIALLLTTAFIALIKGLDYSSLIISLGKGAGQSIGSSLLLLITGAFLGKLLYNSGAAKSLSFFLVKKLYFLDIRISLVLIGFIIGLPMFYTAGFMLLIPLVFAITEELKISRLFAGIPAAAALSVTHGFLPPHPGPVSIAGIINADIAKVVMYGIPVSIFAILIGGIGLSFFISKVPLEKKSSKFDIKKEEGKTIPPLLSLIFALSPMIAMSAGWFIIYSMGKDNLAGKILSEPATGLFIGVISFIIYLKITGKNMEDLMKWFSESIAEVAPILLIIGAGGAFKEVITITGITSEISTTLASLSLSPLLAAWLITAIIRVSVGSATLAGLTGAGIIGPLAVASGRPELYVLAIGAGSLFGSHVNDAGFWLFKEYFEISVKETFLTWTLMESLVSIAGLIATLLFTIF